jgi:putative membrane protein
MYASVLIAVGHFLALGIGFWSIAERTRGLRRVSEDARNGDAIKDVFRYDLLWGIAFLLWFGTGLARAFGGMEKASGFYLHNGFFHLKLTLIAVVSIVEMPVMVGLIKWRVGLRKEGPGFTPDAGKARTWKIIGHAQMAMLVLIVASASLMARGVWMTGGAAESGELP